MCYNVVVDRGTAGKPAIIRKGRLKMKATKFATTLYVYTEPDGTLAPPDSMNHTLLIINDVRVWPTRTPFAPQTIKKGDVVTLIIPSGFLEGRVVNSWPMSDEEFAVLLDGCVWDGLADGFDGGLSGCCTFEAHGGDFPVESSTTERPVPYYIYEAVRRLAGFYNLPAKEKGKLMVRLFDDLYENMKEDV